MRKGWRLATLQDVKDVVSRLRPSDEEECRAMYGVSPASFFDTLGFDPENTYAIYNDKGLNVALAGVAPRGDGSAMIWMIATPDLEKHQLEFLRYSRTFINEVGEPYDLLFNWVDARNTVHIKWLQFCGFTIIRLHEVFGAEGKPFYEFLRIK